MISLIIFISILVCSLLVAAWVLAWSARAVGSSRGRFRVGLVVVGCLLLLTFGFGVRNMIFSASEIPGAAVAGWGVLLVELCVVFVVLGYAFALSVKRTFAPFGAYLGLGLIRLAIALFIIKPLVTEAFVIPTKSMSPTIEPGDRFVVNKIIRPRLDLVAHWRNDLPPAIYCKRLIGFPGERLRFDQGGIYINDQPIPLPPVLAGRCHASPAAVPAGSAPYKDGETIQLGGDEFFLIGDNVDISADSRMTGPSPASSLIGVVDLVYWPLSKARVLR